MYECVQFEVTTRCNFKCFYCAGRKLDQADMSFETFKHLLNTHIQKYGKPVRVVLQGEGEPTLNKSFFQMAAYVVSQGMLIYAITNGTYKHPEHFLESFKNIGVSVDTLDEEESARIGRPNLARTLAFAAELATQINVCIYTVKMEADVSAIARWARDHKCQHLAQPLQIKEEYRVLYPHMRAPSAEVKPFTCKFVKRPLYRYYSVGGVELPCCFIKDLNVYPGIDELEKHLGTEQWPACCTGCDRGK